MRKTSPAPQPSPDNSIQTKAAQIEDLLSNPRTGKGLRKAIAGLLIELAEASGVYVNQPGIAGVAYTIAAGPDAPQKNVWRETALRHLDVLLERADRKTANAVMSFWDAGLSYDQLIDPFPAAQGTQAHTH